MLYSGLYQDNKLYISAHAEQVFHNFSNFTNKNGIFEYELTLNTIEELEKQIPNFNDKIKSIIIDFSDITEAINVFVEFKNLITKIIDHDISVSIVRVEEKLYNDLKLHKYKLDFQDLIIENIESNLFNIFIKTDKIEIANFDILITNLYQTIFKRELIKNYLVPNKDKFSNSSNVYLPKYINIKKYIEDKEIHFYGLYLLCKKALNEKILPHINERRIKNSNGINGNNGIVKKQKAPILFFQSLNGAYLASIFSKLALLDMAYIDHIGPINKIYQSFLKTNFKEHESYLIMSDVVCLGTEIQIAKNLMEYNNSIALGNITIVKVEVIKGKKEMPITSLFVLDQETNKSVKYKIETEFK